MKLSKKEEDEAADKEIKELFRHVVCLAFMVRKKHLTESTTPQRHATANFRSGFILEVNKKWYWLTAGHVIENIEREGLQHHTQVAEEFKLMDTFGSTVSEKVFQYIPFAFEPAWRHYEHDDQTGVDYGIVALGELEKRALKKNNIVPITPKLWKDIPQLKHPCLFVLGFPEDQVKATYTKNEFGFFINAKPTAAAFAMRIKKVKNAKKYLLYASVKKKVGEIAGFSGGPVIAITQNGYEIIALQSGWDRTKRIAFVCPLIGIGPMIMTAIRNRPK